MSATPDDLPVSKPLPGPLPARNERGEGEGTVRFHAQEAREMQEAEEAGKSHSKGEH